MLNWGNLPNVLKKHAKKFILAALVLFECLVVAGVSLIGGILGGISFVLLQRHVNALKLFGSEVGIVVFVVFTCFSAGLTVLMEIRVGVFKRLIGYLTQKFDLLGDREER